MGAGVLRVRERERKQSVGGNVSSTVSINVWLLRIALSLQVKLYG